MLERRSGRLHESIAILVKVTERLTGMGAWAYVPFPLLDLAEVAGELEDAPTARFAATTMEEVARRADRPLHRALAALTSAWTHMAAAEPQLGAAMAHEAARSLAETSCQAILGRAFDCLGQALATTDRQGAVQAFEQAVTTFEACGAHWRRDRALEGLRALGSPGRRLAAALGSEGLTSRQGWDQFGLLQQIGAVLAPSPL